MASPSEEYMAILQMCYASGEYSHSQMAYTSKEYSYSRVAHAGHVHRQKKTLRPGSVYFRNESKLYPETREAPKRPSR